MGTVTTLAPGVSRKWTKVLETRTDTPDLLSSLNTLSSFYAHNNTHFSRNLQSTIDNRSLSINHEFLLSSNGAQQALDRVEEEVNALAKCCDKVDTKPTRHSWFPSVGHWVTMIILKSGAFENSSSLPQRKASPFQVLCRRDMTHYFKRFITALTRGGPGGLPRPIEVHAHDPLHYVDPDVVVDTGPTAHRFSKGLESELGKIETDFSFALDRIFEGISDLLGRETALSNTLWALKDAAQKTFFDILKTRDSRGEAFTISFPCLLLLILPHHLQ
ncbi:unnamed protein product [Camellia sinensis]